MGDGAIRGFVRDALVEEARSLCAQSVFVKKRREPVASSAALQTPSTLRSRTRWSCWRRSRRGVETAGGVLAWRVLGSRDVINGVGVTPPEDNNDGEITDPFAWLWRRSDG